MCEKGHIENDLSSEKGENKVVRRCEQGELENMGGMMVGREGERRRDSELSEEGGTSWVGGSERGWRPGRVVSPLNGRQSRWQEPRKMSTKTSRVHLADTNELRHVIPASQRAEMSRLWTSVPIVYPSQSSRLACSTVSLSVQLDSPFFFCLRGGVTGFPMLMPPYAYFCFFSAGLRICCRKSVWSAPPLLTQTNTDPPLYSLGKNIAVSRLHSSSLPHCQTLHNSWALRIV